MLLKELTLKMASKEPLPEPKPVAAQRAIRHLKCWPSRLAGSYPGITATPFGIFLGVYSLAVSGPHELKLHNARSFTLHPRPDTFNIGGRSLSEWTRRCGERIAHSFA